MTISTTSIKNSYSGDNSTTVFNYTFKISDEDEIQVIIRSATGTETVKTKTTHYTVSGVGNANGGSITFQSGHVPTNTETVVLRRSTPQTQGLDLIENDPMPAENIETAYDKLTAISQELQEQVDRSLKISRTNSMTSTEFTSSATDRASKILSFDASGELSITQELGTFRGNWAASTAYAVRDLVKDTSTNNIFLVNTAHTSSGSQPLTSNANSAKYDLIVDAGSATTSATNAASSATAAANSATAAAASAVDATNNGAAQVTLAAAQVALATTQATNSATSATNAASSATAAASSATSASSSATTATTKASAASTSETNAAASATAAANSATAAAASANFEILSDTTPQLGGNLDTNEKEITTVSNRDLVLAPNGTGAVEIKGNTNSGKILINCENNSHHVSLQAPAHSAFGGNIAFTLPTSTGTNGQALVTNGSGVLSFATVEETKPTVADVSQTIPVSTATTINITGTNFVSVPIVEFIKTDGSITLANTVSFTNATTLSVNVTLASGNYHVRIENPDGMAGRSTNNILTSSNAPTFSTGAGSLGSIQFGETKSFTVAGSSDSTISFAKTSGTFPSGLSLNATTGVISGTENSGGSSAVTANFTITITDQEGQTASRAFAITTANANYFGDGSDGSLST